VALDAAGFRCSMSRKGNCWGNEPAESFFSTIKAECLHQQSLQTRPDAHLAIVQYIRCYDATRRHSTIGFISPAKFEASFLPRPAS
jgi:transposase InsO family protein